SAKVVVVVENKNSRFASGGVAIEICGGKPADTPADYDQIVGFSGLLGSAHALPRFAVAQLVGECIGPFVIAAHASERRRVIAGGLFRREFICRHPRKPPDSGDDARADSNAIQELGSRDRAIHAEPIVFFLRAHYLYFFISS